MLLLLRSGSNIFKIDQSITRRRGKRYALATPDYYDVRVSQNATLKQAQANRGSYDCQEIFDMFNLSEHTDDCKENCNDDYCHCNDCVKYALKVKGL